MFSLYNFEFRLGDLCLVGLIPVDCALKLPTLLFFKNKP